MQTRTKMVGPVIRGMDADLADAVIAAIETDNPDAEVAVEDEGGYIRVGIPGHCRLTRQSLEEELGRSFPLHRLEPSLAGFAGRMKVDDNEVVWYLERQD
ncbi:MAG TPA: MmoB/DmpM family protein [Pseudonocardiaceae bacterium]